MGTEPEKLNYFNYFTEIEEHFQRARGTGLFLLSPMDWALVESWKNAGIPLEAVLRGIDAAFEKFHSRKRKTQKVNSVAYCAQAVQREAEIMAGARRQQGPVEAPFTAEDVRLHLQSACDQLAGRAAYEPVVAALRQILDNLAEHYSQLEELEQRLTVLEEKMSAIARASISEELLLVARKELDAMLRDYRSQMNAEQIAMLERQFLDRRILEEARLPRLSLFYVRPQA